MALGPEDGSRSVPAAAFLKTALAAAERCGVTRLADITRLDRLGLPVWQAVRPTGRSLSVHQGKGASELTAKIGALCEAIESHCAEHAPADGPCCPLSALPPSQRAPVLGDYCQTRDCSPDESEHIQWCAATDYITGTEQYLPHPLVSLDYRSWLPSLFERISGGLGAGACEGDALRTALLEVVERDAVRDWHRLSQAARTATSLDLTNIPFDWFQFWRDRLASLNVDLQAFRIKSIVGAPTFMCVIGGVEEFGAAYRQFSGTSADGDPETALFKALAEAIQSRLALVAGVRDDILPSYYRRHMRSRRPRDGLPLGRRRWGGERPLDAVVDHIVERLTACGYRRVVVKRLGQRLDGVAVTKVFVPGLGSLSRTRRPAL